jgi:hypothetical protein
MQKHVFSENALQPWKSGHGPRSVAAWARRGKNDKQVPAAPRSVHRLHSQTSEVKGRTTEGQVRDLQMLFLPLKQGTWLPRGYPKKKGTTP